MYLENKNNADQEFDLVFEERVEKTKSIAVKQHKKVKWGYRDLVLNLFEKSPEIGRLLVRLHDRNKLYSMAKSPDEMARTELTQTFADLLSFDLDHAESELISDVLVSLINQAEKTLRRSISERLSVMKDIPLRLVLKMANDEIFVAEPMLKKSPELSDFDLIYVLKAQGAGHWNAIASRPEISTRVVDMLADTEDLETAITLVENKSITLSDYTVQKFINISKDSERLAEPLLQREEITVALAQELYQFVGEALKGLIKEKFGNDESVASAIDDVVSEFVRGEQNDHTPSKDTVIHAELQMERGTVNSSVMIDSLRRGKIATFIAQFSVYCALPTETVEEMLEQKAGHSLAITCKAIGITKSDFVNMFLLTTRVRGARIVDETDLSRAMSYYDKISVDMAKALMTKQRH